jgi:uncharacterized RDD family membrane protein YckC
MTDKVAAQGTQVAYGRFSRRLQAVVIDGVIMALVLVVALVIAAAIALDHIGRILGTVTVLVVLLYEPLLVSRTGSTVGHYRTNLRVVDDRAHGNITFMKAVVRAAIKAVLGVYSFVTMATTSRHQAAHDLLTGSTVQIRDPGRMRARDYVTARTELLEPAMPSAGRRIAVTIAWVVAGVAVVTLVAGAMGSAGLISDECFEADRRCSPAERALIWGLGVGLYGLPLLCIVQGWRGRLYGCRVRRQHRGVARVF